MIERGLRGNRMAVLVLAVALFVVVAPLRAAVTLEMLQGEYLSDAYATALKATRSPLEAEKRGTAPVAFSIARAGAHWRITITSFHEGSWRTIESLSPLGAGAYELVTGPWETEPPFAERQRFRIVVSSSGADFYVTGALWDEGESVKFRRIDVAAERLAARWLLAGDYLDAEGRAWRFEETGKGRSPDAPFTWEPSLDTSEACCDYVHLRPEGKSPEEDRVAYRWERGKLELFRIVIDPERCPISRASTPFAVLTPKK